MPKDTTPPLRLVMRLIRQAAFSTLLLLVLLPALLPMLRVNLWLGHDTFPHLFRLVDLDIVLRSRVLYARWLPNLGFFYGFPTLNFYAPLTYYITLTLHWLGAGFLLATKLSYALSFFVAALGMYVWMRDAWSRRAALVAAAVYTYVPYHLANAYVRGTISEHWAQALAPWLFWQVGRVTRGQDRGARLALLVAALLLTHNLSAFLLIPDEVGFGVTHRVWQALRPPPPPPHPPLSSPTLGGGERGPYASLRHTADETGVRGEGLKREPLLRLTISIAIGILATTFYWLPALREISSVRAGQLPTLSEEHIRQLVGLRDLVAPFFLYRYYPDQGTALQHPLAWWQVAVFVLGAFVAWRRRKALTPPQRGLLLAALLLPIAALLLMLRASLPLWMNVKLLALVQFPWRLQTIVALMTAVWAAALSTHHARRTTNLLRRASCVIVIAGLALIAGTSLARLPVLPLTWAGDPPVPVREADLSLAGFARYEFANGLRAREHGDPWIMPFLPTTVRTPREEFWLPASLSPAADERFVPPKRVTLEQVCPTAVTLTVDTPANTFLRWHQFWFPGWRASVDGRAVPTQPSPRLGLVTVPIPAGKHRVRIWFGSTVLRQVAWGLALVGLVMMVGALWRERRRRLLLALGIVAVLWLGLWGWQNARRSTCVTPRAAWFTVGDEGQAMLLGVADARATTPTPNVVTVTAYWLALRPIPQDWKAFLHVVDANGRPLGQHDAFPGENFSPTTRWEVGEIVLDPHTVVLDRPRPPGLHFRVGMYVFDGGIRNLMLRAAEGKEVGSYWEVEEGR